MIRLFSKKEFFFKFLIFIFLLIILLKLLNVNQLMNNSLYSIKIKKNKTNDIEPSGKINNDNEFKKNNFTINFQNFTMLSKNESTQNCSISYQDYLKKFINKTEYKNNIDKKEYELDRIEEKLRNYSLKIGGQYKPNDCEPDYKIAIIIPYRDRLSNLKLFLSNMHPFFINQKMHYGIYIVEPKKNLTFNRGLLMNIGFIESLKDSNNLWDCFFFHDVDMISEDLRNVYVCDRNLPKHYAVAVSKFGYKTDGYFSKYYGGINAFTKEQYKKINGFSNRYFGWGAEDDDLRLRTESVFKKYIKQPKEINRYFMASHQNQKPNSNRGKQLNESKNLISKGEINEGLCNVKYELKEVRKNLLLTHFIVDHPNSKF